MQKKNTLFYFILMHAGFILFAFYSVVGKLAAHEKFLSSKFICLYAVVFFILFVYAILWQQVLKVIPLSIAAPNKSIVILWGIIYGRLFFGEQIKWNMIAGALVVLTGLLVLQGDMKHE